MVYLYILPHIKDYVKFFTNFIFPDYNISKNIINSTDNKTVIADTIKIEHIREVIHFINLRPSSDKKLVVIGPFDNATLEAQNAFLKILEDKPNYACIFLFSHNIHKVIDTIKSRCQIIDKSKLSKNTLGKVDSDFYPEPSTSILNILHLGSTLDRISYINNAKNKINRKDVIIMLKHIYSNIKRGQYSPQIMTNLLQDFKVLEHTVSLNLGLPSIIKQILLFIDHYKITL